MSFIKSISNRVNLFKAFGKREVFARIPFVYKGSGSLVLAASGQLFLGWPQAGFDIENDTIVINNNGKIEINGKAEIAAGCRIDLANETSKLTISKSYINCNTLIVISDHLIINEGCAISWNCQFLDNDFHTISYEAKRERLSGIELGKHVWVGCNVKFYKGSRIADGCVVASDSVIKNVFDEPGCLIGGNPAKVLKKNVTWQ